MSYINEETLQYPVDESDIRSANPNTSFPVPFEPVDGYAWVFPSPAPAYDALSQGVRETAPEFINDHWEQRWEIYSLPTEVAEANLLAAKIARNNVINASRLAANRGNFTHAGKQFSCDELSRSDIDGITSFVTLAGALPPGWPGGWKAVDNTYHPIATVADWAAFVGSMVAAGNANFAKAQALKAQLAAATTSDQINSIAW